MREPDRAITGGGQQSHEIPARNRGIGAPGCAENHDAVGGAHPPLAADQRNHDARRAQPVTPAGIKQRGERDRRIALRPFAETPDEAIIPLPAARDVEGDVAGGDAGGERGLPVTPGTAPCPDEIGALARQISRHGIAEPLVIERIGAHQPPVAVNHGQCGVAILGGIADQRPVTGALDPPRRWIKVPREQDQRT